MIQDGLRRVGMWLAPGWAKAGAWATWFLIPQKASLGLLTWWLDRFPKEVEIHVHMAS